MLGSRYNDKKERLENRRQSFFLSATDPLNENHASTNSILYHPSSTDNNNNSSINNRTTGVTTTTTTSSAATATATTGADLTHRTGGVTKTISHNSTTSSSIGLRRHTMVAKTRSLDSGVIRLSADQDDYYMDDDSSQRHLILNHNHNNSSITGSSSRQPQRSDSNPQDDYGSTGTRTNNHNREDPLLLAVPSLANNLKKKGRSRSLLVQPVSRSSCADLSALDEKPVRCCFLLQ